MILVIDNYDSFTYNLVQYFGETGAEVVVRRNDEVSVREIREELRPARIVISPGPGTPADAGVSRSVVRELGDVIPILGVCLGHQVIAEEFGGRVVRSPKPVHGKPAEILHDGRTLFRGLDEGFTAGRYHSLVVEAGSLPECLEASAHTSDGLIMALRHKSLSIEGVQFHPESILTNCGKRLVRNFLEA